MTTSGVEAAVDDLGIIEDHKLSQLARQIGKTNIMAHFEVKVTKGGGLVLKARF